VDGNHFSDKTVQEINRLLQQNKKQENNQEGKQEKRSGGSVRLITKYDGKLREELETAMKIAIQNGDAVKLRKGKVLLVGEGISGKTSSVRSICGKPPVREHISTIGADVQLLYTRNWKQVKEGNELAEGATRGALLRVKNSPAQQATWRLSREKQFLKKSISTITKSVKRLSNKREPEATRQDEVVVQIDETLVALDESSGTDSLSLTFWDFGGQRVFYAMHHLFLTRYGVYLVVFDMTKVLDESLAEGALEYVEFWMKSISLHAPSSKIFLIGTRLDAIKQSDMEKINLALSRSVRIGSFENVVLNPKGNHYFFPVNNISTDPTRAKVIRQQIELAFENESFINDTVSMSWLLALDKMQSRKVPTLFVKTDVRTICEQCGVDEEQQYHMLELFHRLGLLIFLDQNEILRSRIVLQPQWLINKLTRVIRDPKLHVSNAELSAMRGNGLYEDFSCLISEGRVSAKLLYSFFEDPSDYEYLVAFMCNALLLSRLDEDTYLVPSLSPAVTIDNLPDDVLEGPECWLQFDYLPEGMFQRLVCVFAGDCFGDENARPPLVHKRQALISMGDVDVLLTRPRKHHLISVQFGSGSDYIEIRKALNHILKLCRVVSKQFMGSLEMPQLYLVPLGEEHKFPLAGIQFDKVLAAREKKDLQSKLRLNNNSRVKLSAFDHFFGDEEFLMQELASNYDAFFSHSWGQKQETHKLVISIANKLSSDVKIWIDDSFMKGSVSHAMANGIERSKCVVVFITQIYSIKVQGQAEKGEMDNCFIEFDFASRTKKLIPVVLEKCMLDTSNWSPALNSRCGGLIYIDFTDTKLFAKNVKKLQQVITTTN